MLVLPAGWAAGGVGGSKGGGEGLGGPDVSASGEVPWKAACPHMALG